MTTMTLDDALARIAALERELADVEALERERDEVLQALAMVGWPCRLVELPAKFRELEREVARLKGER